MRVRMEEVPWRSGFRRTRASKILWPAGRADGQDTTATLMDCCWEAVDNIVTRVVDEHVDVPPRNRSFWGREPAAVTSWSRAAH